MAYTNGSSTLRAPMRPVHARPKLQDISDMDGFGTIKWYDPDKRYGFIQPDNGGRDIFIHKSIVMLYGIREEFLQVGVRVGFSVGEQQPGRGPEASAIALA